jgi:transposase
VANWCRNAAIQLDFFAVIGDNCIQSGANGAETPPPPNHDRGVSSIMTSTNYSTTLALPQPRKTYPQDWSTYNAAQTHEQEHFIPLLRELCDGIAQPPQTFGRPRLALSDVVFGVAFKAYTTMSGRRMMTELREAQAKGLLDKAPSFTSTFRYLENPALTPILKSLIEQSALPLKAVETDFAVDSTGFATSTYARWYDHKWGKERTRQTWVKTHIMVGIKTHIVTSVEATPTESNDGAQFPALVERTAQNFTVNAVSADKAYSTKRNLRVVHTIGGTAYVPFKSNATGVTTHHKVDGLWNHMWHFYNFNRAVFMESYHKRSNVETAFSMVKAKFGGAVRSKTPVAQVNEVLCKVLCHNICVLIQSWYELGIAATFGTELVVVPKVPVR